MAIFDFLKKNELQTIENLSRENDKLEKRISNLEAEVENSHHTKKLQISIEKSKLRNLNF